MRPWAAFELAAIRDIPSYGRVGYKSIPALRRRTKSAIAKKRHELRKGVMSEQAHLVKIIRHCSYELYKQIDELQAEIAQLRLDDVGFDVEAPFDPWRFEP